MNSGTIKTRFGLASDHVRVAVNQLRTLRAEYEASDLPERKPRIRALDAKIDALQAVILDGSAHPWIEDGKSPLY